MLEISHSLGEPLVNAPSSGDQWQTQIINGHVTLLSPPAIDTVPLAAITQFLSTTPGPYDVAMANGVSGSQMAISPASWASQNSTLLAAIAGIGGVGVGGLLSWWLGRRRAR